MVDSFEFCSIYIPHGGFCPPRFKDVITPVLKAVAAPNLASFPEI